MSREVRRVPVGWKHPVVYNEHWQFQADSRIRRGAPESRLHGPQEQFAPLFGRTFAEAQADWDAQSAKFKPDDYFTTVEEYEGDRPDDASLYMPDFGVPEDELGWCLYESVSEGTPVTPVFATAEELIDYLCIYGQDWDQEPWRRESAERVVRTGFTLGSMVCVGGTVYRSDVDADRIAAVAKDGSGQHG